MKYIYSAIFTPSGSGIRAEIPDLPSCITTGNDLHDAINQITDAASCWLVAAEDEGTQIPPATPQTELHCKKGCMLSIIQIDTIAYRALTDTRAVRKNVSLPAWMAALADRKGLNCSQILQESLTAKLSAL